MKLTWTMRAVRPFALSFAGAITTSLIAAAPVRDALASETLLRPLDGLVIAQTSMSSPDSPPPAPSRPAPAPIPAPPKMDDVPPSPVPIPAPLPSQPNAALSDMPWGAVGFTANGSYSSNWKMASQAEAEAKAAKGCAQFGRGACQVVSFSGQECVAWQLSSDHTGAGAGTCPSPPAAPPTPKPKVPRSGAAMRRKGRRVVVSPAPLHAPMADRTTYFSELTISDFHRRKP